MKVLVIGGTGLVGSYLLPGLIEKEFEVYALTRSPGKVEIIRKMGATPLLGDIRNPGSFREKLPDHLDRIVLLAMPSVIPGKRITKKRKKALRDETNDFFRNTLQLAREFKAAVILPGGTSYHTIGNEFANESWPILREGLTEIGADTDAMVEDAFLSGNPPAVQLLFGKIYGNGGLFRFQYKMMANGRGKIIGPGKNYVPNIHASDAADAIIAALEKLPVGERLIITDDTPATQGEFAEYMASLMNKRKPGHLPMFMIRLIMGKDILSVISMNCKVSNEKAKRLLDWKPEFPSYKEGLQATLPEMAKGGNIFPG